MTMNYDWYTTNYWHVAAYATLIVKATVYNKPFMFNWYPLTLFFKFPGQFHNFRDARTNYQNPGCPRQSGTYGMYGLAEFVFFMSLIGLKTLKEKEKMLVTSIFSFLMFSKGFLLKDVKCRDCVLKSLLLFLYFVLQMI